MKFTTHNQGRVSLTGTMMVGTIQAQMRQLTQVFGEPIAANGDPKVAAEWRIRFVDGLCASIYAWNQPMPELNEVIVWRIGAAAPFMVSRVHETFRDAVQAAQDKARGAA